MSVVFARTAKRRAEFPAAISADLAAMARRSGLDTLGYPLEMVRLEAENLTHHRRNGPS
jgi:hypothetical protein